jgi:structural maintenance of chromosome 4
VFFVTDPFSCRACSKNSTTFLIVHSVSELDTVSEERNSIRKTHEELRRKRLELFMDGFGQITLKLKEMYQMITLGGDAELELVDSLDPFSEGIVFSVRPPKKSWKNISNLSGGEKTLSSLALVFALHHYKPTPLYVMDEIDAALDFKNVSIVANYIKERTKNAQFVIISLRNNMFELADRLVGIYKTNNCSHSVPVNPRAFGVESQQNGFVPTTPALTERTNSKRSLSSVKDSRGRDSLATESSTSVLA